MARASSLRPSLLASLSMLFVLVAGAVAQPVAAQLGPDVAASISGSRHVRIGEFITYTITATNVGDQTATDIRISGWGPDWFGESTMNCLNGVIFGDGWCTYGSLEPGESASMTLSLKAVAGNKRERHMYELAWVDASNDTNPDNNETRIDVIMTGPCKEYC